MLYHHHCYQAYENQEITGFVQTGDDIIINGIFQNFDPNFLHSTCCSLLHVQPHLNKFYNTEELLSSNMHSLCWSISKYWFIHNKFLKPCARGKKQLLSKLLKSTDLCWEKLCKYHLSSSSMCCIVAVCSRPPAMI